MAENETPPTSPSIYQKLFSTSRPNAGREMDETSRGNHKRMSLPPNVDSILSSLDKKENAEEVHALRRHTLSPLSRRDSIMARIEDPYLDRKVDRLRALSEEDERDEGARRRARSKSVELDNSFHSTYIPEPYKGLHALLVLVQSPLLLLAIGSFSGVIGLIMDMGLVQIARFHSWLSEINIVYFILVALCCACGSTALVYFVSPEAAGSGLPFMKVALSGVDMSTYLTLRSVLVKTVGLLLAYAAALSIGKEGPFIMIACGFAHVLMANLSIFTRIFEDETKRLEMLACACSAGVAATFGSPFGGVLFGVEVTSHFYLVRTLPRSFFAAIVGALLVNFVTSNTRYGLFGDLNLGIASVTSDLESFTLTEFAVFVAIGVTCGLGGALFNYFVSLLVYAREAFLHQSDLFHNELTRRLLLVGGITLFACLTEFYGDVAWFIHHGSPRSILGSLFSEIDDSDHHQEEESRLLSRSLITYLPLKFLLTLLSVTLPIPAGLFTPTFVIGGIFGRLVGEAIQAFDLISTQYRPFMYAIVGAGAFSSGVTHAISTAVIIMEISHNDTLNLPVSVAILASYFTARRFSDNVYDLLITTNYLPRLVKLPKAAYDIPAWEVMRDIHHMKVLSADSTYEEALDVLQDTNAQVLPIVDSHENQFLLATVSRARLVQAVEYVVGKSKQKESESGAARSSRSDMIATLGSSFGFHKDPPRSTSKENAATYMLEEGIHSSSPRPSYGTNLDGGGWQSPDYELPGASSDRDKGLLSLPMHLAFRRGGKIMDWGTNHVCTRTRLTVLVDPSPFQVMEMTPMRRVDNLFRMLKLTNVYLTRSGKLMGVITRDRLMTFLQSASKYKVPGIWKVFSSYCSKTLERPDVRPQENSKTQ